MNTQSRSESYAAAGVDITAGYRAVELMKKHVVRTEIPGVLTGIGGFGGLFEMDLTGITRPVLVSGTDGVGTKLKIAFLMDKHDTVGIDCVAMCVNDIGLLRRKAAAIPGLYRLRQERARRRSRRSFQAWRRAAFRRAAHLSAAKRRKCPASIPKMNTISRDFRSAWSIVQRFSIPARSFRAMR